MTAKENSTSGKPRAATQNGRPRDFGAPEPKPSRKVALDEVLRSLQDLVNNELNLEPLSKPKPEITATEVAAEAERDVAETTALQPAVEESEPTSEQESVLEIELAGDAPAPDVIAPPETTSAPAKAAATTIPPQGLQQELPHLEPVSAEAGAPAPEPPVPEPDTSMAEPLASEFPVLEAAPEVMATAPVAVPSTDDDAAPSEIPVLSDIVDEPEEVAPPASPAALPAAADARKLAIQVAARLNVELRKAGKPGLSSDVIARLAHALEAALAKAASNSENKAS